MKKIIFLSLIMAFVACSDDKQNEIELNTQTVPPDGVPISHPDANLTIDKQNPPMPVPE